MKLHLHPAVRITFALVAVWAVVAAWLGRIELDWWGWPIRLAISVPCAVLGICCAVRPRDRLGRVTTAVFFAAAVVQVIRVQWAHYTLRGRSLATANYTAIAALSVSLGVLVAVVAGLTEARRRNEAP